MSPMTGIRSVISIAVHSTMVCPATRTERAAELRRAPVQSGHSSDVVNRSSTACLRADGAPSVLM
jgi:hypothetical protein